MNKTDYYKEASKKKVRIIDWIKIRNEYETTNISLRRIAKKYNIKWGTLKQRALNQKWNSSKKEIQNKIYTNTTQKTIENISDKQSKALENHYKISEYLLYKVGNALKNENEFNTFVEKIRTGINKEELKEVKLGSLNDKKLINVVNSFEKIQKLQRQTLGIIDGKDAISEFLRERQLDHNIEIDNKKIELEEKKLNTDTKNEDRVKAIEEYLEATRPNKEFLDSVFDDENEEE